VSAVAAVLLVQCRGEMAVVPEVPAVWLVLRYRGNGGFTEIYCSAVRTDIVVNWRLCLQLLHYC
jgi:hypothetical protein